MFDTQVASDFPFRSAWAQQAKFWLQTAVAYALASWSSGTLTHPLSPGTLASSASGRMAASTGPPPGASGAEAGASGGADASGSRPLCQQVSSIAQW
jgi:hypothetical protein